MLLLNMDTVPTPSVESVLTHRDPASAAEEDLVQRRNISLSGQCIVGRVAENGTLALVSFSNPAFQTLCPKGCWDGLQWYGNSVKKHSPLRLKTSVRPQCKFVFWHPPLVETSGCTKSTWQLERDRVTFLMGPSRLFLPNKDGAPLCLL